MDGSSCRDVSPPITYRRVNSSGCISELAPPASIASAIPRSITLADSITARRLEISPSWIVLFGPRASCAIETCEAIMLGSTRSMPRG